MIQQDDGRDRSKEVREKIAEPREEKVICPNISHYGKCLMKGCPYCSKLPWLSALPREECSGCMTCDPYSYFIEVDRFFLDVMKNALKGLKEHAPDHYAEGWMQLVDKKIEEMGKKYAEPREEGGKEFWKNFDLKKWLEDAKEVGEILRKTMEREKYEEMKKNAETLSPEVKEQLKAALPKKEGEVAVSPSQDGARKKAENLSKYLAENMGDYDVNGEVVENGLVGELEKEGEGWEESLDEIMDETMLAKEENWATKNRDDIKNFIHQHFISRTAIEKMIEEWEPGEAPNHLEIFKGLTQNTDLDIKFWLAEDVKKVVRDLAEKINKE